MLFSVEALTAGEGSGGVVLLSVGLSFWGGFDLVSGRIIDRNHPQCGALLSGAVLCMPSGRGSSSSSSVLAEAVRSGVAPAAIILARRDPILGVGALAAGMLYAKHLPIAIAHREVFDTVSRAARVHVRVSEGRAHITVLEAEQ
jgi:predicted aconitase with swiveling domain